jgi:RHS repeat-associated protein
VLSQTNNGWRVDGTEYALLIKKQGNSQHTVTQTYTDFISKHDSVLTLTVPSLVWDTKSAFHFAQNGLTWKFFALETGTLAMTASVAARRGPTAYTFDVSSSEALTVDGKGNLVGDAHVSLSRAIMYPKVGKAVACTAWTYSAKTEAAFICDDSVFQENQLPYKIDPSSQTFTDGNTYGLSSWAGQVWDCDSDGNNCGWYWENGGSSAVSSFNTSGLIPSGGALISATCGFNTLDQNLHDGDSVKCELVNPGFNNSGNTQVHTWIASDWYDHCGCQSGYSDSADVDNITLTVTWSNGVTVTVSPSSITIPVNTGCCVNAYELCAAVDSPNTAATFSTVPPNTGSFTMSGDHCAFYSSPAVVDGNTTITAVATAVVDPSKTGTAAITITSPSQNASVIISPGNVSLRPSQGQQFTATVTNRITQTVNWSLSPNVGTVTNGGFYTAPSTITTQQNITLTARFTLDPTVYSSVTITLMPPVTVSVSPLTASLGQNQTQQFTSTVQNTGNTAVTWSLNPSVGNVNSSGLYTAPASIASQQNISVIATSQADSSKSGSATVTLIPVSVSVSAAANPMYPSQTNLFTATVSGTTNGNVTWSVQSGPGSISGYGVYTSPYSVTSPTAVTVRATSAADSSKYGTATITVNPLPANSAYQWYVSDNLTSIDTTRWGVYTNGGPVNASPGGMTSGTIYSKVSPGDGTNDYAVQLTLNLANESPGSLYFIQARMPDDQNFYSFGLHTTADEPGGCWGDYTLSKRAANVTTTLATFHYSCHDGMTLGFMAVGNALTLSIDSNYRYTVTDSTPLSNGQVMIGLGGSGSISKVQFGTIDRVAPSAVSGSSVIASASPTRVDLKWTAAADDNGGSGVFQYQVSRDGVVLGMAPASAPSFTDETVTAATGNTTYSIVAMDLDGNGSSATTQTVAVPGSGSNPRRVGVRGTGSYWGAAGEQIDLVSGNLNFSLPLVTAKSRGGWSASFMLSYNSQMWRQDASGTWNVEPDLGYGQGWKLQAGSVYPVWYNGSPLYAIFTDATGAEYRLDQNNNSIWTTTEGPHIWYDWYAQTLYFPDGSKWYLWDQSSAQEPDAGTLYPYVMCDSNGNQLVVHYLAGAGSLPLGNAWAGSSARISSISDSRGTYTYAFNWSAGTTPHLASIASYLSPGEQYTFSYGSVSLTAPSSMGGGSFGTTSLLNSVTSTGLNTAHQFSYANGEMTQVTTPLGGTLGWSYRDSQYASGTPKYREVASRTAPINGTTNTWNFTTDSGTTQHATVMVSDTGANSTKVWTFGTSGASNRLATSYEERGPGGTALLHTDYTWTTDSAGNVYVGTVLNTLNPGIGQIQSKSTQTLDTYGNITQSAVYDCGNLTAAARTYNFTYLHTGNSNYDSRYIRNRVLTAAVTPAAGSPMTLVTNYYDGTAYGGCAPALVSRTGLLNHDDANYGTGMVYRGNVTARNSIGGYACVTYEMTGVATQTIDGAGRTLSSAPSADTSYSLPGVLTPGGNSNLATTVTYASSWQVTSVSGPNGAQSTTTYDGYGRPQSSSIPDGATTNYTYTYLGVAGGTANTQTGTIGSGTGARWKRTTLDGFGRVTRVESGHDSTTVSQVDTQYAACACSPLGKLYRVSQPYAPGGSPVWTTYAYDGSGRTISVTAPDGSVTSTQYLTTVTDPAGNMFTGNLVKVMDQAGKWKIQMTDAMGNLIKVLEPNPDTTTDGRYLVTDYTYNGISQLTQVWMRRYAPGSTTNYTDQYRTFTYTGTDLASATNPENGTVTYQYDGDHHVTQRTDAYGQQTRYSYDAYGRLIEVQHWTGSPLSEQLNQRVDYYYDINPCSGFSQNGWGRLTAVNFKMGDEAQGCVYQYSYNQAGRVTSQKMSWLLSDGRQGSHGPVEYDLVAGYEWDNEGRMTAMTYPAVNATGTRYTYQFDVMGRTNGMTDAGTNMGVASATFGVAGEIQSLGYFGFGESRQYNSMYQMTRMTATNGGTTVMDMQYVYSTAQANNGRIIQSIDGVTGETVDYTYDILNRLSQAQTEGASGVQWGQSFTYDGFGNLYAKGVTKGSAPTFSVNINPATNGGPTSFTTPPAGMDVENRPVGNSIDTNFYDHAGKRVLMRHDGYGWPNYMYSSTFEFAMYGLGGQRILTVNCSYGSDGGPSCGTSSKNVYWAGKLVVSRGVTVATDRLGSARANSNGESFAYYPYGEERTTTADGREKFGTYARDNTASDYADQRYYNVGTGRFNVPDPYQASAGAEDPTGWNRYMYVGGDPINFADIDGQSKIQVTIPPNVLFQCQTGYGEQGTYQYNCVFNPHLLNPRILDHPQPLSRARGQDPGIDVARGGLYSIGSGDFATKSKCRDFFGALAGMAGEDEYTLMAQAANTAASAGMEGDVFDGPSSKVGLNATDFPDASSAGATTVGQWFGQNPSAAGLSQQNGLAIYINAADWSTSFFNSFVSDGSVNSYGLGTLMHEILHKVMVGGGFIHDQLSTALDAAGAGAPGLGHSGGLAISDRIGQICF